MDLSFLPTDQLIGFITTDISSDYGQDLLAKLEQQNSILVESGITVKILNYGDISSSEYVIDDTEGEIWRQAEGLKNSKKPGENLILARLSGQDLEILELKPQLEKDLDYLEALESVAANYQDTTEPSDGYFKWGQLVREDGEYLCKDCGYILELREGQIFPICEVCLSGQPDGPAGPNEGYWEKI
jgi:hypothetical protein